MEIEAINRRYIADFLAQAKESGYNWVAFDWSASKDFYVFHGFDSAVEAKEFCNNSNTNFNFLTQDWEVADYRFLPVQTLAAAFDGDEVPKIGDIQWNSIRSQMSDLGLEFLHGQPAENMSPSIQSGQFFPLQWEKTFDLSANVDRFHVIWHRHPGHQVYEIGHSTVQYGPFFSMKQAEIFLQSQLEKKTWNQEQHDYLIVGQYKNQSLQIDQEGWPDNSCGIILKTAFYQYDTSLKIKSWQVSEVNRLEEPIKLKHFLFARYQETEGKLLLFDDRLKETSLDLPQVTTYHAYFSYEQLTVNKSIIMEINMKNYDYLKNQVKFTGFGETLDQELKEKLEQQVPAFQLSHQTKFGQDEVNSTLNFEKSKTSELYFFNSYDLSIKQTQSDDTLKQTYFIGRENNLTLKERYNMLNNRSVFKEFKKLEKVGEGEDARFKPTDESYKSWATLNFKETDSQGNFLMRKLFWDHEKTLSKFPIKELDDSYEKNRLIASLEKGNVQKATIVQDGQEVKVSITANALNKTFDFYDADMQKISVKQIQVQKQGVGNDLKDGEDSSVKASVQKDEKQAIADDNKQDKTEKRRQRMKVS
ncbi:hypothetical protein [Mucilaginibacter lappiensis]|uniref:Uncharacterized protein n=1 Tax=Mucilaginibacter lappiensis TaxID=354630 RepID=A0A841J9S3_9SPHI|nr:hypothetical protein [Mucilaginibacter lappiensis]MBB6127444.1 hypothetical protein [Mucilaginibacter lappiensis]